MKLVTFSLRNESGSTTAPIECTYASTITHIQSPALTGDVTLEGMTWDSDKQCDRFDVTIDYHNGTDLLYSFYSDDAYRAECDLNSLDATIAVGYGSHDQEG